jgi:hypothetical protein
MLDRTTEMNTEIEIELIAGGLHEALRDNSDGSALHVIMPVRVP